MALKEDEAEERKDEYYHFGETHHHRRNHNSFGITNFWLPQKFNDPCVGRGEATLLQYEHPSRTRRGPTSAQLRLPTVPLSYTYKVLTIVRFLLGVVPRLLIRISFGRRFPNIEIEQCAPCKSEMSLGRGGLYPTQTTDNILCRADFNCSLSAPPLLRDFRAKTTHTKRQAMLTTLPNFPVVSPYLRF